VPNRRVRQDGRVQGRALLGSAIFFLVGPGLEAGVGPFVLTGFEVGDDLPAWPALRIAGAVLALAGLAVLVHAFARFARDGAGTPSPLAPPQELVVRGAYRHVRNPMYVATAAVIAGEGLLLRQPILLVAAAVYCAALAALGRFREEPLLRERFGARYDAYRAAVPGWLPRLTPWRG
jgi:protein-S-isoprenylcysteine O-methyltransferase Ste14